MTNKELMRCISKQSPYINPAILKQKLVEQDFYTRPDWNQNDANAEDYIENRPFYKSIEDVEVSDIGEWASKLREGSLVFAIIEGKTYRDFDWVTDRGQTTITTKDGVYSVRVVGPIFTPNVEWKCMETVGTIIKVPLEFLPDEVQEINDKLNISVYEAQRTHWMEWGPKLQASAIGIGERGEISLEISGSLLNILTLNSASGEWKYIVKINDREYFVSISRISMTGASSVEIAVDGVKFSGDMLFQQAITIKFPFERPVGEYEVNFYSTTETVPVYHQLNENFIPNTIARTADIGIIASSTEGSTKKFRIIVDDSGTISAVEVV